MLGLLLLYALPLGMCIPMPLSNITESLGASSCICMNTSHSYSISHVLITSSSSSESPTIINTLLGKASTLRIGSILRTSVGVSDDTRVSPVSDTEVISTPGADIAQFAYLVSQLLSGPHSTKADRLVFDSPEYTEFLLTHWLESENNQHPYFTYHTDTISIHRIASAMGVPVHLIDLASPELSLQHSLLEMLVLPEFTGSPHLALMLTHADRYGLHPSALVYVLQAFFKILWRKSTRSRDFNNSPVYRRLRVAVSRGLHAAQACLRIEYPDRLVDAKVGVMIPNTQPVHVWHPQAETVLRHELAEYMKEDYYQFRHKVKDQSFAELLEELGSTASNTTMTYLCQEKPYYTASLS